MRMGKGIYSTFIYIYFIFLFFYYLVNRDPRACTFQNIAAVMMLLMVRTLTDVQNCIGTNTIYRHLWIWCTGTHAPAYDVIEMN